mmetsp:Transcript_72011/g.211423  ORF Transcript_72011/g.211423 Transcript_72011/m.211423 type:complete len:516 (-) Transcript_72011:36-1583(-)
MGKKLANGGSHGVKSQTQITKGFNGVAAAGQGKFNPSSKCDILGKGMKVKEKAAKQAGLTKAEAKDFLKNRQGKKLKDLRMNQAVAEPEAEAASGSMAVEVPATPVDVLGLQQAAARRCEEFDEQAPAEAETSGTNNAGSFENLFANNPGREAENSRKRFYSIFRTVLSMADVVLEVLDARDPMSCRSMELESEVVGAGKRLVLVLNKIDLVPKHSVEAWTKHLRRSFPVIAFKAAQGGGSLSRVTHANTSAANAPEGLLRSTNGVVGADELMQLLKNYARTGIDVKTRICVGVVGYPNTGKSSIINSMKRHSCVEVGGRSGVTKELQEIKLDSKVTLVDSPGVVFEGATDDPSTVLRNVVRVESISDPVGVVDALLKKAPREALQKFYHFSDAVSTVSDFLIHVAKDRGKMKRGGGLDLENAARSVILDWTLGKFRYFTLPPVDSNVDAKLAEEETAAVVTQLAPAFDIDALFSGAGVQPAVLGAPTAGGGGDDDAMSDGGDAQVQVDTEAMGL